MNLQENLDQLNSDVQNIKASIIDKGVEIQNGTPLSEYCHKIYDVYEAGKNASGPTIDEDKIIEKTVSGKSVVLNDISEIPHDITVKLTSDSISNFSNVKVERYGKNIYDAQTYPLTRGKGISPSTGNLETATTLAATADFIPCTHLRGLVITIPHTTSNSYGLVFFDDSQKMIMYIKNEARSQITTLVHPRASYYKFCIDVNYMDVAQVVLGIDVPIYESYDMQTIFPSADGIVSIDHTAPYLFLTTDNDDVNINATYNVSWSKQTEYEARWNSIQENSDRQNYTYGFAGCSWNDGVYDPLYSIKAQSAFADAYSTSYITDTKVPIIWSVVSSVAPFRNCYYLVTIRDLILNVDISVASNCFTNNNYLENIKFSGTGKIKTAINFQHSPLTKESIQSVVNALSSTTSGLTCTFKKTAKEAAFTTDEWTALTATKSNWEFVLS